MSTPHFCDMARSVDFPPLAEERVEPTGDVPELAVERRRRSYSLLLLSPAIGQRAGELYEGEIGRRGAVEQCRDDPGGDEGERRQQPDVPLGLSFPPGDHGETGGAAVRQ